MKTLIHSSDRGSWKATASLGVGFHTIFDSQGTPSRTVAKRTKLSDRCSLLEYPPRPDGPRILSANLLVTLGVERFLAVRTSEEPKSKEVVKKSLTRRELYRPAVLPTTKARKLDGVSRINKVFVPHSNLELQESRLPLSG